MGSTNGVLENEKSLSAWHFSIFNRCRSSCLLCLAKAQEFKGVWEKLTCLRLAWHILLTKPDVSVNESLDSNIRQLGYAGSEFKTTSK